MDIQGGHGTLAVPKSQAAPDRSWQAHAAGMLPATPVPPSRRASSASISPRDVRGGPAGVHEPPTSTWGAEQRPNSLQGPPRTPVPLAEPGGWAGPAFSPIPGERQGFELAPAFPPAVAGMWWPREQCRHLAPVPSVTVLGAAARAQPCSQGAGRKQMEMTPAAVSCGRTRWLSPPLLQLPSQRGRRDPGSVGIAARACKSPVPHAGTSTLLRPLSPGPAPRRLPRLHHPRRGVCQVTLPNRQPALGCTLPACQEPASCCLGAGAKSAGTRGTGTSATVPRRCLACCRGGGGGGRARGRTLLLLEGSSPPDRAPRALGREDGRAEPQLCVTGCCGPAAATPRPHGAELREGRQARCEHPAQPRKTLHNGGLFGTNSFPINYVI